MYTNTKNVLLFLFIQLSVVLSQTPEFIGPPGAGSWGVSSMAIHPADPAIIYVSSATGALFRTLDGGQTVEPIETIFNYRSLWNIYLVTNDKSTFFAHNDIYVKSTNYSEELEIIYDNTGSRNHQLLFNPINPDIMFMLRKDHEIWRSNNQGSNWFKVSQIGSAQNKILKKIAIAPSDTSVMYASANDKVLKSINSGKDWVTINTDLGRGYDIQVNPFNAESLYLLNGSLYKSTNSGSTFTPLLEYAIYSFTLDPVDSSKIYAVAVPYFDLKARSLFKSTDGGQTWQAINNGFYHSAITDLTKIIINPQDTHELYTNIGHLGVYKSDNGGSSWNLTNLSSTPVNDIYTDPNDPDLIFTSQNGWGVMISENAGVSWNRSDFVDNDSIEINCWSFTFNPSNSNHLLISSSVLFLESFDYAQTWQPANLFDDPGYIRFHKLDKNILFYSGSILLGSEYIYRSLDGSQTWDKIHDKYISNITFHPFSANKVYGTIYDEGIVVSTDLLTTYEIYNDGLLQSGEGPLKTIYSFVLNENNPNNLYCGQDGRLSKSIDGGISWLQIDSSLKVLEPYHLRVKSILLDSQNPGRFYVGVGHYGQPMTENFTNGGLYLTENDGLSWRKVWEGEVSLMKFDNSDPKKLYFNTKFGLMRLVDTLTTGLGDNPSNTPFGFELKQNYPNPFNPVTNIRYSVLYTTQLQLIVYNSLGQRIKTLVNKVQNIGEYTVQWDGRNNSGKAVSSGVYYYCLYNGNVTKTKKMVLLL